MKLIFSQSKLSNLFAFCAAVFVHGGIAVWSMMPSDPLVINQQIIQVSFVAPSANNQKSTSLFHKKITLDSNQKNAIKQQRNENNEVAENISEKKSTAGRQTSGLVDPNSNNLKTAETDPVFDAAYLNNPAPNYPMQARQGNIQGKVLIDVIVKTDGTAAMVAISRSSGSKILDEAALDAVRDWRFIPAKRKGEVVQANVIVPVEFKII